MQTLLTRLDGTLRPSGKVFYGWWIVGSSSGVQMLAALLWMQSYGAYMVLLEDEFGWSKALLAGAFSLTRIESGILGPLQGWLVDRYGPRLILRIGTVLFGIGFILFSQVNSLLTFYLLFFVIALGSSLGGFATLMVSIVNWFDQHRAKAVALSQVGYAVGGFAVPLIIILLETFGWRWTAVFSGIAVIVIGLPLVQVVVHRPSDRGETVDGTPTPTDHAQRQPGGKLDVDFTTQQAVRTPSFWLISFGHALALLTVSSVLVHLIPHLNQRLDFSLIEAGGIISLMTLSQLAGQLVGGFLGDRFNKRWMCAACMVAHCVGLLMVTYATHTWAVLAFAVIHGLAWGIRGPLMVALRADYFGATSFGTIMGFSSLIVMLGMAGGPITAGIFADIYGDYEIGFTVLACCSLVGSLCFIAATKPRQPKSAI